MMLKLFLEYGSTLELPVNSFAEGMKRIKQYKEEGLIVKAYEIKRR